MVLFIINRPGPRMRTPMQNKMASLVVMLETVPFLSEPIYELKE